MIKVLPSPITFEWDKHNLEKSKIKHKVEYKECEEVFFNNPIVLEDIKHSNKESRYFAFGESNNKQKLLIVFTIRKNKIRTISARKMSRKERAFYAKTKK